MIKRQYRTFLALALACGVLLVIAGVALAGELLSSPARATVGAPPAELAARRVVLTHGEQMHAHGWFVPGQPGRGAVLLLHGVRADRRQMLRRARMLQADGRAALLIDLPAHGESTGDRITFGARESTAAAAALAWLHARLPSERIGVIGVSLGAASLVLSDLPVPAHAVVLESMYPTIEEAVENRLAIRLGTLGRSLEPLLLAQLPLRLGVGADDLRPIDHIGRLGVPVLVASGALDEHTRLSETMRLHAAARAPKQLWVVPGAAHVDLCAFDPDTYGRVVLGFLAHHLDVHANTRMATRVRGATAPHANPHASR